MSSSTPNSNPHNLDSDDEALVPSQETPRRRPATAAVAPAAQRAPKRPRPSTAPNAAATTVTTTTADVPATTTTTTTTTAAAMPGALAVGRRRPTQRHLKRGTKKLRRDAATAKATLARNGDSESESSDSDSDSDDSDTDGAANTNEGGPWKLVDELASKTWTITDMWSSTYNGVTYIHVKTTLVNCVDGVSVHEPGFVTLSMREGAVSPRCSHSTHAGERFGKVVAKKSFLAPKFAAYFAKIDARNTH